jgi:hypothetical protein
VLPKDWLPVIWLIEPVKPSEMPSFSPKYSKEFVNNIDARSITKSIMTKYIH